MNKNVPNCLTVSRIIAVPFFILCYLKEYNFAALIIFLAASFTDMLDGRLARKYDLISNFGKFMDPLADKILTYSAFCLFVEDKVISSVFLIVVLFREFAVAGIRMLAAEKGTVIAADIYGKIKTVLQMIGIPLYILSKVLRVCEHRNASYRIGFLAFGAERGSVIILYLSLLMTVVSGFNYIIKNRNVLKD